MEREEGRKKRKSVSEGNSTYMQCSVQLGLMGLVAYLVIYDLFLPMYIIPLGHILTSLTPPTLPRTPITSSSQLYVLFNELIS